MDSEMDSGRRRSSRRRTRKPDLTEDDKMTTSQVIVNGLDHKHVHQVKETKSRKWSVWKDSDTKHFFEGLAEHGKDFASIQAYIVSRSSSGKHKVTDNNNDVQANSVQNHQNHSLNGSHAASSSTAATESHFNQNPSSHNLEIKTREQVRHFYYRTWHKICPALQDIDSLGNDVKIDKGVLEVYGLINYGELLKKIGSKSRFRSHLRELVLDGVTILRPHRFSSTSSKIKSSKPIKIRTPVCKALRKLIEQLDESSPPNIPLSTFDSIEPSHVDVTKLPDFVDIELHPKDNQSFLRVQSMAQNPWMKIRVNSNKRLSCLVEFLQSVKLSSSRNLRTQRTLFMADKDSFDTSFEDEDDTGIRLRLQNSLETMVSENQHKLNIVTPHKSVLEIPSLNNASGLQTNAVTVVTSSQLSFRNYLKKLDKENYRSKPQASYGRKDRSTSTSSVSSNNKEHEKKDQEKNSVTLASNASTITKPDGICDNSCSSNSTMAPFKETVKKLTQLNQALSSARFSHDSHDESAVDQVIVANIAGDKVPSVTEEVSLPPPTATLTQWLNQKEQRVLNDSFEFNTNMDTSDVSVQESECKETVGDQVVLDADSVRRGWTSSGPSPSFAELYLFLKSPERIVLTYEFIGVGISRKNSLTSLDDSDHQSETKEKMTESQAQYLSMSTTLEEEKKGSMSLLDKLLTAASISLSLHKKTHPSTRNIVSTASTNLTTNIYSNSSPNIEHKIFNEKNDSNRLDVQIVTKEMNIPCVPQQLTTNTTPSNVITPVIAAPMPSIPTVVLPSQVLHPQQHTFVIPSAPAPRTGIGHATPIHLNSISMGSLPSTSSDFRSNKKTRIICEDPVLLSEAIKQLQANRLTPKKRQRVIRPVTVGPVQSKSLLPKITKPIARQPTLQTMMASPVNSITSTINSTQVQIISSPTTHVSGFGSNMPVQVPVPTFIIPTVMAQNQTPIIFGAASASQPRIEPHQQPVTLMVNPITSQEVSEENGSIDEVTERPNFLPSFLSNTTETLPTTSTESHPLPTTSSFNSDSLPSLSALLELSLPDLPTTTTSSKSFSFNDNSCGSVSDFITFPSNTKNNSGVAMTPVKDPCLIPNNVLSTPVMKATSTSEHHQQWLLNENSNSLGLSSLFPDVQ